MDDKRMSQTKHSWYCSLSQRRNGNGLHRLGTQPALAAEAYLCILPAGAPYSLACPPSCWLAHAHIANHAWSSAPFSCYCPLSPPFPHGGIASLFHLPDGKEPHQGRWQGPTLSLLCTQTSVLGQVVDRHGKFRLLLLVYVISAKTHKRNDSKIWWKEFVFSVTFSE